MNSSSKLINVTSRQLQAFLEIARLQSFSRAAEQIHLSPSGMSMLVKELEDQMGARLFERTTRSVTLTEAGRRLQPVALRIAGELRSLAAVLDGTEAAVRSRLRVAATPMVSASFLPEVMRAFADSHPHVQVSLADVDVGTVRSRVLDGDADIGFGFFVKPAVGLVRTPLCRFRLMHISPRVADEGQLSSQDWASLSMSVPMVSLPLENPIQTMIEKYLVGVGRPPDERIRVNLIGTVIAMVRAGHGHAIIPSFAADECLRQGLSVAMLRAPVAHIELYLVSRRGTQARQAADDFATLVQDAARSFPR